MKFIFALLLLTALITATASAQSNVNYTRHTYSYESSRYQGDDLRPTLGGVFVDSVRYGWVLISPSAPAKYGYGEKYVAAPAGTLMTQYVGNPHGLRPVVQQDSSEETRKAGGIVLFSFNF